MKKLLILVMFFTMAVFANSTTVTLTQNGDFAEYSHFGFFIDSDNNPNTGYSREKAKGADYLVQENGLYRYPEGAKGWKWERVSSVPTVTHTKTSMRSEIPLSLFDKNVADTLNYNASISTKKWDKNRILSTQSVAKNRTEESSPTSDTNKEEKLPIVIIGPSTVYIAHEFNEAVHNDDGSDCRLEGWGERLSAYATYPDEVYNYAQPGSNSYSFLEAPEGKKADEQVQYGPNKDHYWAKTKEKMKELGKGILLIQYGSNEPYANEIEFKNNIQLFIDEAKALNFTPVLITSIEKRIKNADGTLKRSRGDFPKWMRELADENDLTVLDLNQKSYEEYSKLNQSQWHAYFADCKNRWNNHEQDTHFEPRGAKIAASWISDMACKKSDSTLCKLLNQKPDSFTLSSKNFIPAHNSPKLSWDNAPKGTKSFAVIIDDYDAKDAELNWVHWTLFNIDKNRRTLEANSTPNGALVELNSNGSKAYADPAYPDTHKYVAHIYALDIEDITKAKYFDGTKIYHGDMRYDHKRFEKIFGNYILDKQEITSKK